MKKALFAVALMAPVSAFAAIDLTAVTTAFGEMETAIGGVGALILTAAVLAVSYKWVKAAIFG